MCGPFSDSAGSPLAHLNRNNDPLPQSVDIWSLGAVFSAVATWLLLGPSGLEEFAALRASEVDEIINKNEGKLVLEKGDQFHGQHDVLASVSRWHWQLRRQLKRGDLVTGQILDLVETRMLVNRKDKPPATASEVRQVVEGIESEWRRQQKVPGTPEDDISEQVRQAFRRLPKTGEVKQTLSSAGVSTTGEPKLVKSSIDHHRSAAMKKLAEEHPELGPSRIGLSKKPFEIPAKLSRTDDTMHLSKEQEERIQKTKIDDVMEEYGLEKPKSTRVFKNWAQRLGVRRKPEKDTVLSSHLRKVRERDFVSAFAISGENAIIELTKLTGFRFFSSTTAEVWLA